MSQPPRRIEAAGALSMQGREEAVEGVVSGPFDYDLGYRQWFCLPRPAVDTSMLTPRILSDPKAFWEDMVPNPMVLDFVLANYPKLCSCQRRSSSRRRRKAGRHKNERVGLDSDSNGVNSDSDSDADSDGSDDDDRAFYARVSTQNGGRKILQNFKHQRHFKCTRCHVRVAFHRSSSIGGRGVSVWCSFDPIHPPTPQQQEYIISRASSVERRQNFIVLLEDPASSASSSSLADNSEEEQEKTVEASHLRGRRGGRRGGRGGAAAVAAKTAAATHSGIYYYRRRRQFRIEDSGSNDGRNPTGNAPHKRPSAAVSASPRAGMAAATAAATVAEKFSTLSSPSAASSSSSEISSARALMLLAGGNAGKTQAPAFASTAAAEPPFAAATGSSSSLYCCERGAAASARSSRSSSPLWDHYRLGEDRTEDIQHEDVDGAHPFREWIQRRSDFRGSILESIVLGSRRRGREESGESHGASGGARLPSRRRPDPPGLGEEEEGAHADPPARGDRNRDSGPSASRALQEPVKPPPDKRQRTEELSLPPASVAAANGTAPDPVLGSAGSAPGGERSANPIREETAAQSESSPTRVATGRAVASQKKDETNDSNEIRSSDKHDDMETREESNGGAQSPALMEAISSSTDAEAEAVVGVASLNLTKEAESPTHEESNHYPNRPLTTKPTSPSCRVSSPSSSHAIPENLFHYHKQSHTPLPLVLQTTGGSSSSSGSKRNAEDLFGHHHHHHHHPREAILADESTSSNGGGGGGGAAPWLADENDGGEVASVDGFFASNPGESPNGVSSDPGRAPGPAAEGGEGSDVQASMPGARTQKSNEEGVVSPVIGSDNGSDRPLAFRSDWESAPRAVSEKGAYGGDSRAVSAPKQPPTVHPRQINVAPSKGSSSSSEHPQQQSLPEKATGPPAPHLSEPLERHSPERPPSLFATTTTLSTTATELYDVVIESDYWPILVREAVRAPGRMIVVPPPPMKFPARQRRRPAGAKVGAKSGSKSKRGSGQRKGWSKKR